jgi:hypothetical protein
MLTELNGFFAFNAGIQVYYAGQGGHGYDLQTWNEPATWQDTYQGLADDLFCFGQDVLGTQFAVLAGHLVSFDPETGEREDIGHSLEDWAGWLLDDPDVNGTAGLAKSWQDANGALGLDQRLLPSRLLVLGGAPTLDNLMVKDAAECMRIRGPMARQIHDLPDGTQIRPEVIQ